MRPSRFTEEQIIGLLKEQEAGVATADVCRKHGIPSATFYNFMAKCGGMDVSDDLSPLGGFQRPSHLDLTDDRPQRVRLSGPEPPYIRAGEVVRSRAPSEIAVHCEPEMWATQSANALQSNSFL